ncbi:CSLREA domain-containing protein [Candidatus Entotheonella palauensis]|uniref:CSLREA domain-containing protein n=1 Tax=Candidatus Entotheonella palauensis TaxID=93172 RepID=UPI000B7D409C|nr:CSLREA domain-containing protein [Candidatus Entotheonella palauensis]
MMLSCMIRMKTYRQRTVLWLSTFMVILSVGWSIGSAQATCILVNTTDDELNGDGDCSLREAIEATNTDAVTDACVAGSGADNICVPEGVYTLTQGTPLAITSDLSLLGAGADLTFIQAAEEPGTAAFRVLTITSMRTVYIADVTIRHGNTSADSESRDGGCILNSGSLSLVNCAVRACTSAGDGGAIRNFTGSLTLRTCEVSDNATQNNGAAIFNGGGAAGGTLTLIESTITRNTSNTNAGGVYNNSGSDPCIFLNSMISENMSLFDGGGVVNFSGAIEVINSTVNNNMAERGGGGGIDNEGKLSITNSTIINNDAIFGSGVNNHDSGITVLTDNSMVINNTALLRGGGIDNAGTLSLTTSTVSNNTAGEGGGIKNREFGTAVLIDGVVTANGATTEGGGLHNDGTIVLIDSLLTENAAPDSPDCHGIVVSVGETQIGNEAGCDVRRP